MTRAWGVASVVVIALGITGCGSSSKSLSGQLSHKCSADSKSVLSPVVGIDLGTGSGSDQYQFDVTYKDKSGTSHIATVQAVAPSGLNAGTSLTAADLSNISVVKCDVNTLGSSG